MSSMAQMMIGVANRFDEVNCSAIASRQLYTRAAVLVYALYTCLVMPFICWGAWAVPGHPHSHPHFVFSPPVMAPSDPMTMAHAHHESSPVAQALPEMSLAMHVPLLLLAGAILVVALRYEQRVHKIAYGERQFLPFVPTPPPRVVFCGRP